MMRVDSPIAPEAIDPEIIPPICVVRNMPRFSECGVGHTGAMDAETFSPFALCAARAPMARSRSIGPQQELRRMKVEGRPA